MRPIYAAALVAVCMGFPSGRPSGAATYKATVLPPLAGFTHATVLDVSGDRQVGWARAGAGPFTVHAVLWDAGTTIDLNPPGYATTVATALDGQSQGGYGSIEAFGSNRALLWQGSAASVTDLHPAGFPASEIHDISGDVQVGTGLLDDGRSQQRALMWRGSAASVVQLHPSGFENSYALGVSGNSQVGAGYDGPLSSATPHALLWHGTADSVIDLHPTGFDESTALAVSGETQVGSGIINGSTHALLWRGSAESVIDLNPAGFRSSGASAVAGKYQVGTGSPLASEAGTGHALIWTGTAESVVDLHQFLADLPYTFLFSNATGVDERGNVVGIGITTQGPVSILWTPVPEPASAILTVVGALSGLLLHRRLRVGHRLSSGRS